MRNLEVVIVNIYSSIIMTHSFMAGKHMTQEMISAGMDLLSEPPSMNNLMYLASHVGDQYVPGSQVSVDKSPAREVVETQSHLFGEF